MHLPCFDAVTLDGLAFVGHSVIKRGRKVMGASGNLEHRCSIRLGGAQKVASSHRSAFAVFSSVGRCERVICVTSVDGLAGSCSVLRRHQVAGRGRPERAQHHWPPRLRSFRNCP